MMAKVDLLTSLMIGMRMPRMKSQMKMPLSPKVGSTTNLRLSPIPVSYLNTVVIYRLSKSIL